MISRDGEVVGYQAKNQIPLEEEAFYVPNGRRGCSRSMASRSGSLSAMRDGARAASRGARLVFHPQLTGSDHRGVTIERWGIPARPTTRRRWSPAPSKTRSFASVNYAMRYRDSATSLIGPEGECLAHVPYGREQLLVHDLDLSRATGLCARRFNPALYPPE